MWDERHPQTNISVNELYSKLIDMYWIAGPTFSRVGQLYLFRNAISDTGLADAFIDSIPRFISTDEAERAAAEQEIIQKAKCVLHHY